MLNEDIVIPLKPGDTFLAGKFKNKRYIYASDYTNEKGDIIIITSTGKEVPACKIRLMTETVDETIVLDKVIESYIHKHKSNDFLEGDCANFADALTIFISWNWPKYRLNKDYYFITLFDEIFTHTVLYFNHYYFDANGKQSKKEIEDSFGSSSNSLWKRDEGTYNIAGVNSKQIASDLQQEYERLYESIQFSESLKLSDFKAHSGVSDFTKPFMKDRQKIKGAGNKSAKLSSVKVNKKKDYVTFIFKSKPTYNNTTEVVDPNTMSFKPGKVYTQQIRLLDFFALAETKPGFKIDELSFAEVKEILQVADIQVWCSCGSFTYQGLSYYLTQLDGAIHINNIKPERWNTFHDVGNSTGFICKHLSLLINSIDFWINPMTSMINRVLKNEN